MRAEIKNLVVVPSLIILSCCSTKPKEIPSEQNYISPLQKTKSSQIVLVNAGESNRCQIGELVQEISKCNPKAIGINFLFLGEKDSHCDSVLRASIINSDKVVLVEGFEDGHHVQSSKQFTDVAFLTGLIGFIQNKNGITDRYYRLIDYRGKWELSFPFLLALQVNKGRSAELSSKVTPQEYPIKFYYQLDEFNVFDYNTDFTRERSLIEDKIVIIGYLGPTQEDILKTPVRENSSATTYGSVILANIILDILKDLN